MQIAKVIKIGPTKNQSIIANNKCDILTTTKTYSLMWTKKHFSPLCHIKTLFQTKNTFQNHYQTYPISFSYTPWLRVFPN
jgi:hypothetical protein